MVIAGLKDAEQIKSTLNAELEIRFSVAYSTLEYETNHCNGDYL